MLVIAGVTAWYLHSNSEARAFELASEAEAHFLQGRHDEARQAIGKAIAIRDDVPQFHLLMGRANFQAGDLVAAFVAYSMANSLAPENQETLLAIAQIGLQIGEIEASKAATRTMLLADPRSAEALLVQGIHYMNGRDYEDAIESADAVLQIEPAHEEATILKIRAHFLNDDKETARSLVEESFARSRVSPGMTFTALEIYRELGETDRMIETFDELLESFPENNHLRFDEAHLYYKLGEQTKASSLATEALANENLEAREIDGLVRLLRLYADSAEIAKNVALVKRSGNMDARIELGKYLLDQGQIEAANTVMAGITGLEARVFEALKALRQDQVDLALSLAEGILDRDKTHCFAQYIRAEGSVRRGNPEAAVLSAQSAMSECPGLLTNWSVLARAYTDLGKPEQAERVFKQGIDANPQEPELVERYASWLLDRNRHREAVTVSGKLARLMPSYTPAWDRYLALCQEFDPACIRNAQLGLEHSTTLFGADLPPGERAAAGLFGRFLIR